MRDQSRGGEVGYLHRGRRWGLKERRVMRGHRPQEPIGAGVQEQAETPAEAAGDIRAASVYLNTKLAV